MKLTTSLRLRLTLIILFPLLIIAVITGIWQIRYAQTMAADVFDRSLLSAALAVTNDVASTNGDALSSRTQEILADTSGGRVFYNVYAPDGVMVAGFEAPPAGGPNNIKTSIGQIYFNGNYMGTPVRGLRVKTLTQIDGTYGLFTTTVWQDVAVRSDFVTALITPSLIAIGGIIFSLMFIVWFGVKLGLTPLLRLQQDINLRSSNDLTPIGRAVPAEIEGIVETLNRLFTQVSQTMVAQSEFVSNAAHQLRNPIAGVLSLAEAVHSIQRGGSAKQRANDLVEAARGVSDLAQKLLIYERAKTISPTTKRATFSLSKLAFEVVSDYRKKAPSHVSINMQEYDELLVTGDSTMLKEALSNLLDNSFRHGGSGLSKIEVELTTRRDLVVLKVTDDGIGIRPEELSKALERFGQVSESSGSGLGLPIVSRIAEAHQGALKVTPNTDGMAVSMELSAAS